MPRWSERLAAIVRDNADRPYLIDAVDGVQTSYGELARYAASLARQLESRGLRPGDRVGIDLPNGRLFVILYFACLFGGYTVVPVNNALALKDRAFVLGRSRLAALVSGANGSADLAERIVSETAAQSDGPLILSAGGSGSDLTVDQTVGDDHERLMAAVSDDRLWSIHFTSGTTSLPKGVAHRVGALLDNADAFNRSFGIGRDNRFVHVMPMPYMAGFLNTLLGAFTAEAAIILAPQFAPQSALRFWEPVAAYGGDTIWMSPTMLATLTQIDRGRVGRDICRTRRVRIFSGTAPLSLKTRRAFEAKYQVTVAESYGLSELLLLTANDGAAGAKDGSVGPVLPEVDIAVRGPEAAAEEAGSDGAIWIRTPHASVGYLDYETGQPVAPTGGWFDTGDVGYVDADGYLFVTGRVKDLIIRGGFNISPRQIEELLLQHPGVQDAAVVGVPHDFYGEEIVAAVIPAAGRALKEIEADLRESCLLKLGRTLVPDRFIELSQFPKTSLGKVQKNKLRDVAVQMTAHGSMTTGAAHA